jgi:drug/metabolite transporter (DMT)-like permease
VVSCRRNSPRSAPKERSSALGPSLLLARVRGLGEDDQCTRQYLGAEGIGTPIVAWAFLSQRPHLAIWPASLAALLGIFLMAGASWRGLSPGDLLALLSATGFAIWTLAVGHYVMRTHRPVLMTAVQLAVSGVICTGTSLALYGLPASGTLAAALPEILFIGLVSKGFAYVLMAIAQQHAPATTVAILVSAEAVFGALVAALVLGETLGLVRGIGTLCIILGVVIAARIPFALPQSANSSVVLPPAAAR